MQAENNNDIAITEAKLKDFLSSVLSSEGIVVDIRRTFIEYNGVNRSRVFARHANRMACKGSNEKFVVIALLCYPALQWLLKAQDIDALIEKLKEENEDESVWRMSNIQRMLFCAGDGERLTQDNLVAIEQNSVKANVQKEGLLHRAKNRPIQESEIEKQESASSETASKTDVEDDEP